MCNILLWLDGMVVRIVADLSLLCDLSCVQSPEYLISPLAGCIILLLAAMVSVFPVSPVL